MLRTVALNKKGVNRLLQTHVFCPFYEPEQLKELLFEPPYPLIQNLHNVLDPHMDNYRHLWIFLAPGRFNNILCI